MNIIDNGTGNIVTQNQKTTVSSQTEFRGNGNSLVIGKNVRLDKAKFLFNGDNASITIENDCKIRGEIIVLHSCKVTIGTQTKFNKLCRLHCGESGTEIAIGSRCLFADVRARTSDSHSIIDIETGKRLNWPGNIVIEDDVWIAEDVYIYKGSRIGRGSIVGARSTVLGDLPSYALCVGSPAKAVRFGVTWNETLLKRDDTHAQTLPG